MQEDIRGVIKGNRKLRKSGRIETLKQRVVKGIKVKLKRVVSGRIESQGESGQDKSNHRNIDLNQSMRILNLGIIEVAIWVR